jgi:hypothetical protein
LGGLVALALLPTAPAGAYNRDAAVAYAIAWAARRNRSAYYDHASDCANFVSQCLIAGGFRFRSTRNPPDNNRDNTHECGHTPAVLRDEPRTQLWAQHERVVPDCFPLTSVWTFAIKDPDKALYSRTVPKPSGLVRSLLTRGYRTFTDFSDGAPVWDGVRRGDVVCQLEGGEHAMFISGVLANAKDLRICGHSNDRADKSLNEIKPDWKRLGWVVVCIPDEPALDVAHSALTWTTDEADVTGQSERRLMFTSANGRCAEGQPRGGKGRYYVYATFDCEMDTSRPAVGGARPSGRGPFVARPLEAYTASPQYRNGWYVGATPTGFLVPRRTWVGYLPMAKCPRDPGLVRFSVSAAAADGSAAVAEIGDPAEDWPWLECSVDPKAGKAR